MEETTPIGQFDFSGNELKIDATIDDAPKVRGGRKTPGALLVVSGDLLIPDPTPEDPKRMRRIEKAFVKVETDDSGRGGGQVEVHGLVPGGSGADVEMKRLLTINTKQIVAHVPFIALAGVFSQELPWPWEDPTHGFTPGDFGQLNAFYGFECEDVNAYISGRMSWSEVVRRMDVRDDFRKFPKEPPPPPPPPPPSSEPTETHGIPAGDFAAVERIYGFPSNDVEQYMSGRMTWPRVIEHMDERNDYVIFPRNNDADDDGA